MHRQSTFSNYVSSMFKQSSAYHTVMHQSIPAAPICPPWQSRGWGICKFCSTRGPGICQPRGYSQAFDMHAVSYQNITTQRILLENKHIGLIVKDRYRKKLKRVEQTCSRFYACIFSLLIKPALHSEIGAIDVKQRVLVFESNFCWYYLMNILSHL